MAEPTKKFPRSNGTPEEGLVGLVKQIRAGKPGKGPGTASGRKKFPRPYGASDEGKTRNRPSTRT